MKTKKTNNNLISLIFQIIHIPRIFHISLIAIFSFFLFFLFPVAAQATNNVFYSVGQTTDNLMTGTPTLTISSGTATFNTAQTGNIGVGDRVTYNQFSISDFSDAGDSTHTVVTATGHTFQNGDYVTISGTTNYNGTFLVSSVDTDTFQINTPYVADDATGTVANLAYISAKTDTSKWSLINPTGTTPNDVTTAETVVSIKREYTSLESAIAGASDANHIGISDLVATGSITGEVGGTGDGTTTTFNYTLAHGNSITTSSLTVHYTIGSTAYTATDDGSGNISGTDCSGTIDYSTKAISLTFTTAPDDTTDITNDYSYAGADVVLNIPCYYDTGPDTHRVTISGYTTGADNYIKIYTPNNTSSECNTSQRHSGKWDTGKYRLENAAYLQDYFIAIQEDFIRIEGLQINVVQIGNYQADGIYIPNCDISTADIRISHNIIKYTYTSGGEHTYIYAGINVADVNVNKVTIYNNIIYGWRISGTFPGYGIRVAYSNSVYAYNNTISDCEHGMDGGNGNLTAKNCVVFNCSTDDFNGTMTIDYCASDDGDGDHPVQWANGSTDWDNVFVDYSNEDFHLKDFTGTGAIIDQGTDLSSEGFSDDIDGDTRTNHSWDIGADEVAEKIYRSVGPSKTTALQDDNAHSDTLTISGSTATFSVALADNIGVGDVILYDSDGDDSLTSSDSIVFIYGRTDSTHYTVKNQYGGVPANPTSANDTWAIYRAYTSLANAEAGTQNTSIPISFTGGNRDLVANNEQWNIACYANGTTVDTTTVTIDGWTTGEYNYLKIYTPYLTSEVGTSQRHSGKWDATKYNLAITATANDTSIIDNKENNVRIKGLQVLFTNSGGYTGCKAINIDSQDVASDIRIDGNILKGAISGTGSEGIGIYGNDVDTTGKIYNNLIYDFINGATANNAGIKTATGGTYYLYNNTLYGNYEGINATAGTVVVKNTIAYDNTTDYSGTFDSSSDYNISSDTTSTGGIHDKASQTVSFVNVANNDFHLSPFDTSARDAGINLSSDPYLSFSTDIDGKTRDNTWDIGADELMPKPGFRSQGTVKFRGNVKVR